MLTSQMPCNSSVSGDLQLNYDMMASSSCVNNPFTILEKQEMMCLEKQSAQNVCAGFYKCCSLNSLMWREN
jgi:hypothetical protein